MGKIVSDNAVERFWRLYFSLGVFQKRGTLIYILATPILSGALWHAEFYVQGLKMFSANVYLSTFNFVKRSPDVYSEGYPSTKNQEEIKQGAYHFLNLELNTWRTKMQLYSRE